jgi:4'-phosphopantetheinyl transferase
MSNEIPDSSWLSPPASLVLASDEVHIWRVPLNFRSDSLLLLESGLSEDERKRAGKYYFQRDRNRYIAARGILRTLLGRYLAVPPSKLQFAYGRYGKPSLSSEFAGSSLFFNVSHSHELALLAFTRVGDIGVDVEYMRADVEYMQLAQHFFSEHERHQLVSLSRSMVQAAFFCCWTRKEAYIKARGLGLQLPLAQFDVSVHPEKTAAFLGSREEGQNIKDWSLYNLLPGSGYAAACVVKGVPSRIHCLQWTQM